MSEDKPRITFEVSHNYYTDYIKFYDNKYEPKREIGHLFLKGVMEKPLLNILDSITKELEKEL